MSDWQPQYIPPEPEPAPRTRYPFWEYKDVLVFAAAAVPSFLAAALLVRFGLVAFDVRGHGEAPELLAGQFLGYGFWFSALFLFLRTKYGRPFWKSLAWTNTGNWERTLLQGVLLAIGVAAGSLVLQTPDMDMPIKRLLANRLAVLLIGVAAATLGPVCEELAFRGFLMPLLVRSLGPIPGVVLTALPFALLHGPQYGWSWRHLLFIVIAGTAFGWKRHKSGSTAAAAVMHAAYNLTFFAAYVLHGKDMPTQW